MSDNADGAGEQLAKWLKEAGRRARKEAGAVAGSDQDDSFNSPASLHRYVEGLAGRPLQSHAEVLNYLREVALVALLSLSYLHYYYWEVQVEIAKLNSVRIFVPTSLEKRA